MSGLYNPKPNQKPYRGVARTPIINIDSGASSTVDYVPIVFPVAGKLHGAKVVYTEATDAAGADSADVQIGTAAGGTQVVAATSLDVSKAVGDDADLVLVKTDFLAGDAVFVRHSGLAATEDGEYFVQLEYSFDA